MALVYCDDCGRQISSKAGKCPHCGCPVTGNEKLVNQNHTKAVWVEADEDASVKPDDSEAVQTAQIKRGNPVNYSNDAFNRGVKKANSTMRMILLIFGVLIIVILFGALRSSKSTGNNELDSTENASLSNDENNNIKEINFDDAEAVFEVDLITNWEQYVGKVVKTSILYSNYLSSSNTITTYRRSNYDLKSYDEIKVHVEDFDEEKVNYGDCLTVVGVVDDDKFTLENAEVLEYGDEATAFAEELEAPYLQKMAELDAEEEEAFRNGELETPSYDDLMRYSDSYKDKKIKVSVYVTEAEADGVIFDGTIWATYQGQQVTVVDNRKNKEPKILTGDSLTIYGYGAGLGTVKTVVDGSGIFGSNLGAKEVSKVEIPKISIVYCDFN